MTEPRYVRVGEMATHDGKHRYTMFAVRTPVRPLHLNGPDQQSVLEWCTDQFGPPARKRWQRANVTMLGFRDEADAVAFKIRWG